MSRADEFLDLYKQLEQAAIDIYGFSPDGRAVSELERMRQYDDIRRELKYCREVRNFLSHNEKIDDKYSVEPSESMLSLLQCTINRVENPGRCYEFSTKHPNILTATTDDFALPMMRLMSERGFSHVPVVENGAVKSVFSASTPFSYVLEHGTVSLTEETRISHFAQYLPMSKHTAESFRFLGRNTLLSDAEVIFMDSLKQARRIAMLFITEHGKRDEKLLGILTPHDLMGK